MIITHEYYKLFITILTTSLWRHYQVIITYWKSFINVTILTYYAIGPFLHDYYPLLLRHYKGFHYDQSLHISEWQSLWIYSGNLCKCVTVVTVNQYVGHHFQMLYPHLANDLPTPWCFSPCGLCILQVQAWGMYLSLGARLLLLGIWYRTVWSYWV